MLIMNLLRRDIREIFVNEFRNSCDDSDLNDVSELYEDITKLLDEKYCREILISCLKYFELR